MVEWNTEVGTWNDRGGWVHHTNPAEGEVSIGGTYVFDVCVCITLNSCLYSNHVYVMMNRRVHAYVDVTGQ